MQIQNEENKIVGEVLVDLYFLIEEETNILK